MIKQYRVYRIHHNGKYQIKRYTNVIYQNIEDALKNSEGLSLIQSNMDNKIEFGVDTEFVAE